MQLTIRVHGLIDRQINWLIDWLVFNANISNISAISWRTMSTDLHNTTDTYISNNETIYWSNMNINIPFPLPSENPTQDQITCNWSVNETCIILKIHSKTQQQIHICFFWCYINTIRVITKLPNTEQSSKGKSKTHKSTNRQNQSTNGKLGKPQWPWLGTGISKEMVCRMIEAKDLWLLVSNVTSFFKFDIYVFIK